MTLHYSEYRDGFDWGQTWIASRDDQENHTGIDVGVLKLAESATFHTVFEGDCAYLLMSGNVSVEVNGQHYTMRRNSLFDESASCIHGPTGTELKLICESDTEFTVYQTANQQAFAPRIYQPEDVVCENRGKGAVDDACWRQVRTIFGVEDGNLNSNLVLGEVITLPGRWSSYPPHHHPQPEIYHYRFTDPRGYGHAELGDKVLKVKQFDTVKITDLNDHSQCAAPGYGMYYSWVIRHLPNCRYVQPEFTDEHTWIMHPDAKCWRP